MNEAYIRHLYFLAALDLCVAREQYLTRRHVRNSPRHAVGGRDCRPEIHVVKTCCQQVGQVHSRHCGGCVYLRIEPADLF